MNTNLGQDSSFALDCFRISSFSYETSEEGSSKENDEYYESKAKRRRRDDRYRVAKDGGDDKRYSACSR